VSRAPRVGFLPVGLLCAVLVAFFLVACPGVVVPLERPRVQVTEVSAAPDSAGDVLVRLRLVATNPNSEALSARAFDWEVAVAGIPPWRGRSALTQTLASRAGAEWDITLTIPAAVANDAVVRLDSGARAYHVSGTLHFTGRRGEISAFFDQQGGVTWVNRF
jgi:hypothetical protein